VQRLARPRVALIMLSPVAGADELGQEDWPSRVSVVQELRKILSIRPDGLKYELDLLVDAGQRLWVPDAAVELKLRILIAAHAGPAGNRGSEPTKLLIQRHFLWAGARKEVDGFVQAVCNACRQVLRGCDGRWTMQCMPTLQIRCFILISVILGWDRDWTTQLCAGTQR
jgi:hypothetical protein